MRALLLALPFLLLAACGDDPKAEFLRLLKAEYDGDKACLTFTTGFPIKAYGADQALPNSLVQLGILSDADMPPSPFDFGKIPPKGYDITEKGKEYMDGDKLCYGEFYVSEVIDYNEPAEVNGLTASTVKFTLATRIQASWAKDERMSAQIDSAPKEYSRTFTHPDKETGWRLEQ